MIDFKEMAINMLGQQAGNNPVLNNAVEMAKRGDMKGIENLCRNICKERGLDPNQLMNQVMSQFGNIKY